jgi:hypothetical protein
MTKTADQKPQATAKPAPTTTPAPQPHFDVKAPDVAHYTLGWTDHGETVTAARFHDNSIRIAVADHTDIRLQQPVAGQVSRAIQMTTT